MSSHRCMGCLKCSTLGKILACIQLVIGVVLMVLGPLVYPVSYSYGFTYQEYYYTENFAAWTVGVAGALLFVGGIILLMGVGRGSAGFLRTHISLTIIVVVGLISCAMVLLINYSEVGLAISLIFVSMWLIISVGFVSKYGRAMITVPMVRSFPMTVVTPAPQPAVQPVIQNTFINQTSYAPPSSTNYNHPPPQPYPNQQYLPPYNTAYGYQAPSYQPPQQYGQQPQYPNAAQPNAYVNPPFNPAMNPQFQAPSAPAYSAPPTAPATYGAPPVNPTSNPNPPNNPAF